LRSWSIGGQDSLELFASVELAVQAQQAGLLYQGGYNNDSVQRLPVYLRQLSGALGNGGVDGCNSNVGLLGGPPKPIVKGESQREPRARDRKG